jgi:hypothetical protein
MRRIFLLLLISCVSFSVSAQIGKWTAGCYYLLDSSKVCGSIKWNSLDRNIQFKTTDTAGKVKIKTTDLKAFVIKADSFVISHNPDLLKYPVLMVSINTPLKLYMSLRENAGYVSGFGSGGSIPRYFYGSNPNDVKQISRKNFIEVLTKIMAGNEFFVEAIKDGRYSYDFIYELLLAYDTAKQRGLLNKAKQ